MEKKEERKITGKATDLASKPGLPFQPAAGESHKAFESFMCYLDIGQNRSCAKVGRKMGIHASTIKRWSRRYQWSQRIRAYDEELLGARVKAEKEAWEGAAEKWSARTLELKEREWEAASKLLAIASEVLASLAEKDVTEISLGEAAKAVEIASKIGRLATGLATESREVTGAGGGAIRIEIEAALEKVYGKKCEGEVIEVEVIGNKVIGEGGGEGRPLSERALPVEVKRD